MKLGTFHTSSGRTEIVTAWLNKKQAAGHPAFAVAEDLYSTGGRYTLVDSGRGLGPFTIRRDHDLNAQGFQRMIERNYYDDGSMSADVYVSANDLAVEYVEELRARLAQERESAERVEEARRTAQRAEYEYQSTFRAALDITVSGVKFKKTTATLAMPSSQEPFTVTGVAYAGLLVHRSSRPSPDGKPSYDVSHVASGMRCNGRSFNAQADGKAVAVRLAGLGDWTRSAADTQADKELCAAAKTLVQLIEKSGPYVAPPLTPTKQA